MVGFQPVGCKPFHGTVDSTDDALVGGWELHQESDDGGTLMGDERRQLIGTCLCGLQRLVVVLLTPDGGLAIHNNLRAQDTFDAFVEGLLAALPQRFIH